MLLARSCCCCFIDQLALGTRKKRGEPGCACLGMATAAQDLPRSSNQCAGRAYVQVRLNTDRPHVRTSLDLTLHTHAICHRYCSSQFTRGLLLECLPVPDQFITQGIRQQATQIPRHPRLSLGQHHRLALAGVQHQNLLSLFSGFLSQILAAQFAGRLHGRAR